uniref:Uncharacterized protein n=1 Tax=Cacopsylla melanoneura TaxID=428564 RepID=A0A8D8W1Z6_9HEMI
MKEVCTMWFHACTTFVQGRIFIRCTYYVLESLVFTVGTPWEPITYILQAGTQRVLCNTHYQNNVLLVYYYILETRVPSGRFRSLGTRRCNEDGEVFYFIIFIYIIL